MNGEKGGLIAVTLLAHLAGCAEPDANPELNAAANPLGEAVETTTSALRTTPLNLGQWPQGLDCGLGYYRNGVDVEFGVCQGKATAYSIDRFCYQNNIATCTGTGCAPGFIL